MFELHNRSSCYSLPKTQPRRRQGYHARRTHPARQEL